ncbi:UNVERIFIED_CONTAM: hypothetical protein DV032_16270 [Lacticaseibacillus paracasei]|nr:hypothetical protein [Lacticaseibacillus paracasei]
MITLRVLKEKQNEIIENEGMEEISKIGEKKMHVNRTIRNEASQQDCVGFNKNELQEGIIPR